MKKYDKDAIPVETAVKVVLYFEPYNSSESTYQVLMHNHLRRMDRAGVIDFDSQDETVKLNDIPVVDSFVSESLEWDPDFATDE